MNDYYLDYWKEAINCSLEDMGLFNALTYEQKVTMAKDMHNASEQEGMAFGHDSIPNPLHAEIDNIKRNYDSKIKELEEREHNYRKSVATRRNVAIESVYMDRDGSVMIDPRLA